MKIGIYGGTVRREAPLVSIVDEVVEMEERGFASYWFPQVGTYDALTMIGLAGQKTSTIEIGTAVVPSYPRHPTALAPRMLKSAGEVADGTVTWMVGRKTIAEKTIPGIREAAEKAGRGDPRVIVGLPVCVHDDAGEARDRAIQIFKGYGLLPNYKRQLEAEGLTEAGEIAVVGTETEVKAQLEAFFDAGATEVIASVFPAGQNGKASFQRTQDFLATLATTEDDDENDN